MLKRGFEKSCLLNEVILNAVGDKLDESTVYANETETGLQLEYDKNARLCFCERYEEGEVSQ